MTPAAGRPRTRRPKVAFVLGGGGHMGAHEVGMLRALLDRAVKPDLVVGTSVGALKRAAVAWDPSTDMLDRLEAYWRIPPSAVPRERDRLVDWLFEWWERIDDWIDQRRTLTGGAGGARSGEPPGTATGPRPAPRPSR